MSTSLDWSKILGGTKILGEKVSITDEFKGVSKLLGGPARSGPPVYAYAYEYIVNGIALD